MGEVLVTLVSVRVIYKSQIDFFFPRWWTGLQTPQRYSIWNKSKGCLWSTTVRWNFQRLPCQQPWSSHWPKEDQRCHQHKILLVWHDRWYWHMGKASTDIVKVILYVIL